MTQLNPITSAIIVNQQTVARQDAAQTAHIQRTQSRQKNIASTGDRYEPETVESAEKMDAAHDENRKDQPNSRRRPKSSSVPPSDDGSDSHALDVTA